MSQTNKGVIWFLILAFAGAWTPWGIAMGLGLGGNWLALLPGGFAPAIAAFVVRKWITREGFADAGLALNLRKWPYYVFALLLPFFIIGFIVLEAQVLGLARPDFSAVARSLGAALHLGPASPWATWTSISALLIVLSIISTPLVWGEEFGWRGYLQVRLFPRRPLPAAVATGLIWAAWHYPVIFRGLEFPGHPFDGAAVFTVCVVLVSIIFGWLRSATGSVWSASVAHASTDIVGSIVPALLFGPVNVVVVGFVGLLAIFPLGIICAWICWRYAAPQLQDVSGATESRAST